MPLDRISAQVRWPVPVKRSVNEYQLLIHDSEQAAIIRLVQAGLEAEYERLGIDRDPAVTASELLRILGDTWEGELSREELSAFGKAREALDRIAEIRSRESS
jgi:hypothetical protein